MKNKKSLHLLALVILLCMTGCSKDFIVNSDTGTIGSIGTATATTGSASPNYYSATCNLTASAPTGAPLTAAGICCCKGYSTPNIDNANTFSVPLSNVSGKTSVNGSVVVGIIDDGTTYSYRAYAVNSQGISYGATRTFTTLQ